MKVKSRWVIVSICFVACGALAAWFVNDNNLLQGANTQAEIASLLAERRNEMTIAFLACGLLGSLAALGVFALLDKLTNRGGET